MHAAILIFWYLYNTTTASEHCRLRKTSLVCIIYILMLIERVDQWGGRDVRVVVSSNILSVPQLNQVYKNQQRRRKSVCLVCSYCFNVGWVAFDSRKCRSIQNFKIFSPINLPYRRKWTGSEKIEKFWPHMGFPPELFFQKSSIFSNKSHRTCLVVRLSAERSVYINV